MNPKIIYRIHIAGVGGSAVPIYCLGLVLRQSAWAVLVHEAQIVHGMHIAGIGGFVVSIPRFGVVLRQPASAFDVIPGQLEHGGRVADIGGFPAQADARRIGHQIAFAPPLKQRLYRLPLAKLLIPHNREVQSKIAKPLHGEELYRGEYDAATGDSGRQAGARNHPRSLQRKSATPK